MSKLTPMMPVSELSGVGPSSSQRLKKLGIRTALDLLGHTPYRYDDFSRLTPIAKLAPGERTSVRGTVQLIENKRLFRRRMFLTQALIKDDTGSVKVVWFNQPFIAKHLAQGDEIFLAGELSVDKRGPQMTNPTYEKVKTETAHTARIIPVYHTTQKLTQKQLRYYVQQVLPLAEKITDWLPEEIRTQAGLKPLDHAARDIHYPDSPEKLEAAQRRLAFNELFLVMLSTLQSKRTAQMTKAPSIPFHESVTRTFVQSLPFQLTQSQREIAWEILRELGKSHPMNRLLEGDVGSGKTVVATIALANVALAGYQSVLLVPTEILAQQHFDSLRELLKDIDVDLALLTRSRVAWTHGADVKKPALKARIKDGRIGITIGTHALLQETVHFPNLGLAVIDEQHRFGVGQRKMLMEKSSTPEESPHLLSMTATPIPRSLALTVYGDLDLSVLKELPGGRKPIATKLIPSEKRDDAYEFIRERLKDGEQAFVICPLIDPSDTLGKRSVTAEAKKLSDDVFSEFSVGMLHGKMKPDEKERIMRDFREQRYQLLVATSVIEVGIDIPGATIMLIEDAERFGLAQLHQFRGRVGRREQQSYCFLFTAQEDTATLDRLQKLVESGDGFALAEADLKLRGPGEFWGSRQSGIPELKFVDLTDRAFVSDVRKSATQLLADDPTLTHHSAVKKRLERFHTKIHWE